MRPKDDWFSRVSEESAQRRYTLDTMRRMLREDLDEAAKTGLLSRAMIADEAMRVILDWKQEDREDVRSHEIYSPKVKPLEWWKSDTDDWCADTVVGRYQVVEKLQGQWWFCFGPHGLIVNRPGWDASDWASAKAAKDAAQSDYEHRILSALF